MSVLVCLFFIYFTMIMKHAKQLILIMIVGTDFAFVWSVLIYICMV